MEELDLKQQLHLLQKGGDASVALTEETKLNLLSAIDGIRIELEALRRFLERSHPDFAQQYAALKEEVVREVDPEWMEQGASKKE